jgi:peptidoglycan/xylan/chitin deacetylase (PgdA/CDA1 family)
LPARRIAVPLAAAAIVVAAAAALHGHDTPIADRARHVPVLQSGFEMRDLPAAVSVSVPHRGFHGPKVRTPVPVLMYHAIGPPPVGAPFPELFVAASLFRAQVAALAAAGYHAVTLDRVWQAWHGRAHLPRKPVVLSFDDGYHGDFGVAMPALRRHGWPAVLNLLVANLHRHDWGLRTWMVQRMVKNGWEIASHTLTHPDLRTLSSGQLWREVHGSRVVLQGLFHVPVDFFCYPYGDFDAAVIAAVRRTGYFGATTTLPGLAQPSQPDTLRRIRVDGGESPPSLLAMIAAA